MLHIFIPMLLITNTNLSIKCIPTLLNYRISHMRNGYTFTYVRELKWKWKWELLSHVQLFATPWTVHGILQARILEWLAFPFSRRSSQPRDQTQVSRIAGRFFTSWATCAHKLADSMKVHFLELGNMAGMRWKVRQNSTHIHSQNTY